MGIHLSLRPTVLWLPEPGETALIKSSNPIKAKRKKRGRRQRACCLLTADTSPVMFFSVLEPSLLPTGGVLIKQVKELLRCHLTPTPCEWRWDERFQPELTPLTLAPEPRNIISI